MAPTKREIAERTVSKDVAERIMEAARKDFLKQRCDLGLISERNYPPTDSFLNRSMNL
jgi:hypothetical protein